MRARALCALFCIGLLSAGSLPFGGDALAGERLYPVGMERTAFTDGDREIALTLYYPAAPDSAAEPVAMPFYSGLRLLRDAAPAPEAAGLPLILFSHGRGSNALPYAWFGQYLAARGHVVAALDHYRANSYDAHIAYLANRLWQRPIDIGLAIDFLLAHDRWSPMVDAERIGVAGHSQGGFTALWIGGARVSAERYLAFQTNWRRNWMVPEHLRRDLPLDPAPALDVHDARVKAAFAMAPGIVQAFGMDANGLAAMRIPVHITVGARDTQAPPGPNAAFAASHIPGAELVVFPGLVDHEIFVNLCDQDGRDEFPEACIDAEGVDRAAIHQAVGEAALRFFTAAFRGPDRKE